MNSRLEKLAMTKWKEMLPSLSEAAKSTLTSTIKPTKKLTRGELRVNPELATSYKIHDYERDIEGLEKGTDEIIRKHAPNKSIIRTREDIDTAVSKGSIPSDRYLQNNIEEILTIGPASITYGHVPIEGAMSNMYDKTKGVITRGNLSFKSRRDSVLNVDKQMFAEPRSMGQRYVDALTLRHEADEVRSFIHNAKQRLHVRDKKTGKFNSGYTTVLPTETAYINNIKSNHGGVDVLEHESNNITRAPKFVRDKFIEMRRSNNETSIIPHYGTSAKYNNKFVRKTLAEHTKGIRKKLENHPQLEASMEWAKAIPLGPVK